MKSLQDLNKEELLTFIYNNSETNVNIFDKLATCVCCGVSGATYHYECSKCQELNRDDNVVPIKDNSFKKVFELAKSLIKW